jgi:hypothetical protein
MIDAESFCTLALKWVLLYLHEVRQSFQADYKVLYSLVTSRHPPCWC